MLLDMDEYYQFFVLSVSFFIYIPLSTSKQFSSKGRKTQPHISRCHVYVFLIILVYDKERLNVSTDLTAIFSVGVVDTRPSLNSFCLSLHA